MYINISVISSGNYLELGCLSIGGFKYLYLRGRNNRRMQKNNTTYKSPLQQY